MLRLTFAVPSEIENSASVAATTTTTSHSPTTDRFCKHEHAMPKTRSSGKGKEVPYSSPEPRGPSSSATSRGSTSSRSTRRANSATATASVAATITMGDDFGNFQPVASTSAAQPGDTRRAKRRRDDDWDPTSGTATAAAAPASSRSPKKAHKGGRPIKVKGTASRKLPVANGVPGLSATTAIPAVSSSHAQADMSGSIYAFAGPSKREARDSPSLSPPASYTFAARIASVSAGPTKAKAVRRTPQPVDRLTQLPRELLQHIFSYIAAPLSRRILPPVNAAGGNPPGAARGGVHPQAPPDRNSLVLAARVCRELLPLARAALYRDLLIETRVQAHTLHRTLHANELSREVRHIVADVEAMARTSSQWTGALACSLRCLRLPWCVRLTALKQAGSSSTRCTPCAASSAPVAHSRPSLCTCRPTRRRGLSRCVTRSVA